VEQQEKEEAGELRKKKESISAGNAMNRIQTTAFVGGERIPLRDEPETGLRKKSMGETCVAKGHREKKKHTPVGRTQSLLKLFRKGNKGRSPLR